MSVTYPRVRPAGESMLVVEFEPVIDVAVNARVTGLARELADADMPGLRDIVPTFRSLAVFFDPLRTDTAALGAWIDRALASSEARAADVGPLVRIPVWYGGEWGPDLVDVAARCGCTPAEVVARHAGREYHVFMMGFVPGFAYLGTVDERIHVPRRATPRTRVPAGSVAIAGPQTGVYPIETPGGWNIIGRTEAVMFDRDREAPFLLTPGARVRFDAIEVP